MVWDRDGDTTSEFDLALWGYDRNQVDRCLEDLTARLEEALSQLTLVEALQVQLGQARLELDQLRQRQVADPVWNERLATIMAAAEQLWDQATRDADAIRAQAHHAGSAESGAR